MQTSNTPDPAPILKAEGLGYKKNDNFILQDISFELFKGDRLAVVGSSGSGKSTLLRLVNRLIEPTHGTVYFENTDYRSLPPRHIRRQIGLVLQSPSLFPGTVASNLRFGPMQKGETISDEVIQELLERVNLPGYAERDINNLSGGEAQRVSLARTLANSPQILLLDEPTSALDESSRFLVEELLCSIADSQEITCIIVTHDLEQAARMAKKALVLDKGLIKRSGPIEEVIHVK